MTNSITFIIYAVAMLKVVIILSVYTHTQSKMPLFDVTKWSFSWGDITDPTHITK